jgi:hypothetical protein
VSAISTELRNEQANPVCYCASSNPVPANKKEKLQTSENILRTSKGVLYDTHYAPFSNQMCMSAVTNISSLPLDAIALFKHAFIHRLNLAGDTVPHQSARTVHVINYVTARIEVVPVKLTAVS